MNRLSPLAILCGLAAIWSTGCGSSAGYVNQGSYAPYLVQVSGGGQTANKGTAFAQPLGAKIAIDSSSMPIYDQVVLFADPDGKYWVTKTWTDGWAHLKPTLAPSVPGSYTFTAGVDYDPSHAWPIRVTVVDNPASSLAAVLGPSASTAAGTAFPTAFQVKATDATGLVVAGVPVTFQAPSSGASCSFGGFGTSETVLTDEYGLASTQQVTANGIQGSYLITFSSGAMNGSFTVSNL